MISDPLSVTENYLLRQSNYLILHIPCVQSWKLPTGSNISKLSDYLLVIALSRQTWGTDIWLEEMAQFFFSFLFFGCSLLMTESQLFPGSEKCKTWRSQGKKITNSSFPWQKCCYPCHFKVLLCHTAKVSREVPTLRSKIKLSFFFFTGSTRLVLCYPDTSHFQYQSMQGEMCMTWSLHLSSTCWALPLHLANGS